MANRTDDAPVEPDPGHQLALFGDVPSVAASARTEPSVDSSRRSNGRRASLTLAEAARIIREAVKDKSYRKTPLGQLVGRYLRWFRNEYGATDSTIRDYEAVLARMSLLLADREPLEVSTEDLREVIDTWAMRHAYPREGHLGHPSLLGLGRGGRSHSFLPRFEDQAAASTSQDSAAPPCPRRRCSPRVRRDLTRPPRSAGSPRLRRPPRRARRHPRPRLRRHAAAAHRLRQGPEGTSHSAARANRHGATHVPRRAARVRRPPARAGRLLLYPEKRTPDRRVYWADPKKACAPNTVHRWWYRMLEQAGLVGHGVRSGLNMHRARHTFATDLRRVAGVEAASQALGHSDLSTTLGIYGHQDQRDLERAMEAFAEAREAEEAASRGNDSPSQLD